MRSCHGPTSLIYATMARLRIMITQNSLILLIAWTPSQLQKIAIREFMVLTLISSGATMALFTPKIMRPDCSASLAIKLLTSLWGRVGMKLCGAPLGFLRSMTVFILTSNKSIRMLACNSRSSPSVAIQMPTAENRPSLVATNLWRSRSLKYGASTLKIISKSLRPTTVGKSWPISYQIYIIIKIVDSILPTTICGAVTPSLENPNNFTWNGASTVSSRRRRWMKVTATVSPSRTAPSHW